jgi:predicted nucleic-acid-binding Zn-ribbon protein
MEPMIKPKYRCPKCDGRTCTVDEFRAEGSIWARLFYIPNKRFTTLTCTRCSYTEMYRTKQSKLGDVIDFIAG